MDRHAKKRKLEGDSEVNSEAGSNHSDEENKEEEDKDVCINCGLNTTQLHVTSLGNQCSSCYQYWR